MTKDEIMEIALEAGIVPNELVRGRFVYFAELISEAEREECAKLCESYTDKSDSDHESHGYACANAIRARGQA